MNFHCLLISRHMPWEFLTFSMMLSTENSLWGLNIPFFRCDEHFWHAKQGFWAWAPQVPKSVEKDQKSSVLGSNSAQIPFSKWFFAVLCRFRQGASRKAAFCQLEPGKQAFSKVFLPYDSFSGFSFSGFSDAMDISGNRNKVFGHRRCPNLLKMTKKVPFSAGTRREDCFPIDFDRFSSFLPRRQPENSVLPVRTQITGVFEGIFALR